MELVQVTAFGEQARVEAAGGILRRGHGPLAPGFGMVAEIPGLPVVHAGTRVEDDPGITPRGAGELVEEARGEHGPFSPERMARDADALRVDLGSRRENMPGIGGGVGEHRERFHGRVIERGPVEGIFFCLGGLFRPDRECHEAALRQLVGKVAMFVAHPGSGLGFVIDGDHGGERAFGGFVRNEKVAGRLLRRSP